MDIRNSDNRGFKTIEDTFSDGLPNAVLQHDRYFCHFNCEARHHQVCTAHLLRDLKYLEQLYKECHWATEVKADNRSASTKKANAASSI